MKKAIAITLLLTALFACKTEQDCVQKTMTMKQNTTYYAEQNGEVSATVNGCHGVIIYVNDVKTASSNDYKVTINCNVNTGDKYYVTSSCLDPGITVKYRTICN